MSSVQGSGDGCFTAFPLNQRIVCGAVQRVLDLGTLRRKLLQSRLVFGG